MTGECHGGSVLACATTLEPGGYECKDQMQQHCIGYPQRLRKQLQLLDVCSFQRNARPFCWRKLQPGLWRLQHRPCEPKAPVIQVLFSRSSTLGALPQGAVGK